MGRTLILGGTGTIGSHLVRQLVAAPGGLDLVAAARSTEAAAKLREVGMASVEADLRRPETLAPAMRGVDTMFMLKPYGLDYLIQSKIIIDSAKKAGVRHIVNLGSFGAEDTIWTPIGWNRLVESYLAMSGIDYTHLRPNFFMDNVAARTDLATGKIRHYFGSSRVSWIAAEDIAAAAAVVLHNPAAYRGAAYPLAAQAASMPEIAEILSNVFGRTFTAEDVPSDIAFEQLTAAGWGADFARPFVEYMAAIAAGKVAEVADTADTIEQLTGRPALSWQSFAERNRQSYTA
jgi:NAD(P)H dehydrogenase (quinone)